MNQESERLKKIITEYPDLLPSMKANIVAHNLECLGILLVGEKILSSHWDLGLFQ